MEIRRGDIVQVISGNDKGQRGRVLNVMKEKGRVLVEGVRMIKRHTRPNASDPQGGIRDLGAIHHQAARGVDVQVQRPGQRGERRVLVGRSVAQGGPGHGTVERARVQVAVSQRGGQPSARGRLAAAKWSLSA